MSDPIRGIGVGTGSAAGPVARMASVPALPAPRPVADGARRPHQARLHFFAFATASLISGW
ncbi:hypothetical protein WDV06_36170, partial [Streptomyces racemochromogenes]